MKKEILLMAIGCLLPMSISAICFKYVAGPKDLDTLRVEVDATKVGSNLPTVSYILLTKGNKWHKFDDVLIGGKALYVTIKEHKGRFSLSPLLIKGKELDRNAAYDIAIDSNKNVTFTKVSDSCQEKVATLANVLNDYVDSQIEKRKEKENGEQ